MVTLGSLFDGSGGFPLAGALCGIEPMWASEVEPYPIAVTREHFPNMQHLGDINTISGYDVYPVDIITFGSPCQDLSIAGNQAGIQAGTRSGLFLQAVRIIKEMREATNGRYPRYALWENVPGAFGSNKGEDFRTVLQSLIEIVEPEAVVPDVPASRWAKADCWTGDEWSIAWRTLDAKHWGVPQRRSRIYLVADFRGQRAGEILFDRPGLRRDIAKGRETGQGASGITGKGFAECYRISSYDSNAMKSANPHSGINKADISPTLDCNGGNPACNQGGVVVLDNHPADSRLTVNDTGIVQTLTSRMGTGGGNVPIVMCMDVGLFEVQKDVAPTMLARQYKDPPIVSSDTLQHSPRRLTPTECAKLQGFPSDWGKLPAKGTFTDEEYAFWTEVRCTYAVINGKEPKTYSKEQMLKWYSKLHTDSAEYKMWGNGIALPTALYVMEGILETF